MAATKMQNPTITLATMMSTMVASTRNVVSSSEVVVGVVAAGAVDVTIACAWQPRGPVMQVASALPVKVWSSENTSPAGLCEPKLALTRAWLHTLRPAPRNMALLPAVPSVVWLARLDTFQVDRSWSKAAAPPNIDAIVATLATSHADTHVLNCMALLNMCAVVTTLETSQAETSVLKVAAPWNIASMLVTAATSHRARFSWLKMAGAPAAAVDALRVTWNNVAMVVTRDVSQAAMAPYVLVASVVLSNQVSTAV